MDSHLRTKDSKNSQIVMLFQEDSQTLKNKTDTKGKENRLWKEGL